MKPIVDGIEDEYADELRVLRINMQSPAGKSLGGYYKAYMTPTFIFLDSQGVEQWRSVGNIDRQQIERYLTGTR